MNCYKCKQLIDKIHSDCINDNELQSVLHHINECDSCNAYYNAINEMLGDLSSLEDKELPKGFHNKLHFALKREIGSPAKSKKIFSTGMKAAAVGAFSVLLVLAAVSILPNKSFDALPNMAKEEAMEAPAEMMQSDMEIQGVLEAEAMPMATETAMEREVEEKAAVDEAEGEANDAATASGYMADGGSHVLVIDVKDIDQTYEELLPLIPQPLPDSSWVLEDIDEPLEYKQLRGIMNSLEAYYVVEALSVKYKDVAAIYDYRFIDYDNYTAETADLQDFGYVLIVIK